MQDISAYTTVPGPGFEVTTFPLNHPGGALGYRLNFQHNSLCHVIDTEHTPGTLDQNILNAVQQTDLMIYDSTYTDATFAPKKGWGHSTWEQGIRLALAAKIKHLALYHHDHSHTDDVLGDIDKKARKPCPQPLSAAKIWSWTFREKPSYGEQTCFRFHVVCDR